MQAITGTTRLLLYNGYDFFAQKPFTAVFVHFFVNTDIKYYRKD